jgi:hypothetical protein
MNSPPTRESENEEKPLAAEKPEETKTPSTRIVDHFTQLVMPKLGVPEQFFSFSYFHEHHFFHSKTDKITPEKKNLLKSCPGPRITAFTQGSIYFPYEKKDEVLEMISYDVQTECPMYWNQIAYDVPNEGCRLVIDLDSDIRILSNIEINKIARILWSTLKEYYTDFDTHPIDIYIAKCGPRIKKKNLSTGVHIVCHVKVTIPQAKQIIYGFNLRIAQDPGINMKNINIDDGIYKEKSNSCSTRMIYCNKLEKCPVCEDDTERRRACNFCNKDGVAISKSTYEPMGCIHPETGKSDAVYFKSKNNDFLDIVKNYSIWPEVADQKHTYAKPSIDPMYVNKEKVGQKRQGPALSKQLKKIRTSDPSYSLLEEFIQNLTWKGNKWWSGITITNIALTENERLGWVYVTGIGSTMCPYAMKDHGDNRIWFSVSRNGVLTVYCHSVKEEYGCKTKDRIKFDLPGKITQQIFGLEGPPSLQKKSLPDDRNFNFHDFIKKQNSIEHTKPNTEEDKRNKLLKRLSEFYELHK